MSPRVGVAESLTLQDSFHLINAKPICNWSVNLQCFFGDFELFFSLKCMQSLNIVQPVCKLN